MSKYVKLDDIQKYMGSLPSWANFNAGDVILRIAKNVPAIEIDEPFDHYSKENLAEAKAFIEGKLKELNK